MLLTALLLAVVQAGTEFLPVSSSGHLFLLGSVLGIDADPFLVAVDLHIGVALAGIVHYRREYRLMLQGLREPGSQRDFLKRYVAAQAFTLLVAAALAWFLYRPPAVHWSGSGWMTGSAMLLNAAALLSAPRRETVFSDAPLPSLTWRTAAWVGLAQGVAAVPGLSRSGLTIVAGLWSGLAPGHSAAFSFLLAPPVIMLGALYWTTRGWPQAFVMVSSWQSVATALLVMAVTFAVALLALRWTLSWVRTGRIRWFAVWSAAAGAAAFAGTLR